MKAKSKIDECSPAQHKFVYQLMTEVIQGYYLAESTNRRILYCTQCGKVKTLKFYENTNSHS